MPKISVLLPFYNAYQSDGSWFKKAIDSILNQSFTDLELILICQLPPAQGWRLVKRKE